MLALLPLLVACVQPEATTEATAFSWRRDALVSLSIPDSSRGGADLEGIVPLRGEWELRRSTAKVDEYAIRLPVREVWFGHSPRSEPRDLRITGDPMRNRSWSESEGRTPRAGTWALTGDTFLYRVLSGDEPPPPEEIVVRYNPAVKGEAQLNLDTSGLEREDFVFRSEADDGSWHRGLLLPAPAEAVFHTRVPENGVLTLDATVLRPYVDTGESSDGATLRVTVDGRWTSTSTELALRPGEWEPLRWDLASWAGYEVDVRFATEPGESALLDYVFVADPVLYTPVEDPRRVLLVYIDTLRPDHLGAYGADPSPSPTIDAWAQQGVVFTEARTVASWTLPGSRAALSGNQPEIWTAAETLPGALASRGYRVVGLGTNAFFSPKFGMAAPFGRFDYRFLEPAPDATAWAAEALSAVDRPTVVLVHHMEPHLPYREPPEYRAGSMPMPMAVKRTGMRRGMLEAIPADDPDMDAVRAYMTWRYDANIRYLDAHLDEVFRAAGDDAVTVLFSDHGEEFWEHGGFEHGHAIYDEVLRVPLVIRAPGLEPGRRDDPVSLLDITPTVLALLGEDPVGETLGVDLFGPAASDDRAFAFGRTLRGPEAWGAMVGDRKWITQDGVLSAYDLDSDPGELTDVLGGGEGAEAFRVALGAGMGHGAAHVLRIGGSSKNKGWHAGPSRIEVRLGTGVAATWRNPDPIDRSPKPELKDGRARVLGRMRYIPNEWYVLPEGEPHALTDLTIEAVYPTGVHEEHISGLVPGPDGSGEALLTIGPEDQAITVSWDVAPLPFGVELSGYDEALDEQLRVLGYVDDDE